MLSESNNTQNTVDTLIPVSKNFLKKTLVKNEATQKANRELLHICKQALAKQAEKSIDIKKQKQMIEYNKKLKDELYKKTQKIKMLELTKEKQNKVEIKAEDIKNTEFENLIKNYNIIKKILLNPINNKKELLSLYKNIPDSNIDIYNIMIQ